MSTYGGAAAIYAGGIELLPAMKEMRPSYRYLVDIKPIPELNGVTYDGRTVAVGAAATHREIERSAIAQRHVPILADIVRKVGNPRVRTLGTIGGNICRAEPQSDLATVLLSLDATCVVTDGLYERRLPIDDLLTRPYETALAPSEVLVSVEIPAHRRRRVAGYAKFNVHERTMLGVAVVLDWHGRDEVVAHRITVGAATPTPRRSAGAEAILTTSMTRVARAVPKAAAALAADAGLEDDEFGAKDYKEHLVGVLLGRVVAALTQAIADVRPLI